MMKEGLPKLQRALWRDLHKNPGEALMAELGNVMHDVKYALQHLESWMAPETVETGRVNRGAVSQIYHDPLGVVLVIGAWNYPVHLTLSPLVGALSAGNCCCVKMPSEKYSGHTSRAMAELIAEYLDPNAVQVIEGARESTQAVLEPRWDLIFFTGGAFVGKMVHAAAAKHLTPTILELGGKSPTLVAPDAASDPERLRAAARRIAWGSFSNSGQTCIRPDYAFVHASVADAFVDEMRRAVREFYGAAPQRTAAFGRVINQRAHDRLTALLDRDRAFVAFGGDADRADKYVAPTLLDFGDDFEAFTSSAAMADEIFGPILPVYRYTSTQELVDFVNARDKPLAMYLFSEDEATVESVLGHTSCGGACVNETLMHLANPKLPFGGVGRSGMGSYHGHHSFKSFSHSKSVLKKTLSGKWDRGRYKFLSDLSAKAESKL
jgi:acyl-CoA reductase-like NAD-dependent aldehyde dehydrogenase